MHLKYRLVNVFTRSGGRLTGNPLCVFEDARDLSDEQMQALALQFNLSETTFVLPSTVAHARVRIFTPTYEMPFAGHPTLGTAHVVRSIRNTGSAVRLELNVGVIPVTVQRDSQGDRWELRANAPTARRPQAADAEIAAALGLDGSALAGRPLWVNAGTEQLIVPLVDADAVRRVDVNAALLKAATADGPRAQAYVFAPTGRAAVLARFFFNKGSAIIEDPATGSATANLGGWYLANESAAPLHVQISQGEQIGRPSALFLRIDAERNVYVAGDVTELGAGHVTL